jgi:hypothetical protein
MSASPDFPDRKAMLAKVHLAKKELGLDDGTYRIVVARITGKDSAGACRRPQLVDLLAEFKRLGWGGAPPRKTSDKPYVRKVFALWRSFCESGLARTPTPAGLKAFVKRMSGVDDPEWLDPRQAGLVIEGLKAMIARGGE